MMRLLSAAVAVVLAIIYACLVVGLYTVGLPFIALAEIFGRKPKPPKLFRATSGH